VDRTGDRERCHHDHYTVIKVLENDMNIGNLGSFRLDVGGSTGSGEQLVTK